MMLRINTSRGEMILYRGAEFLCGNLLWSIVDFERDGVLCEMELSEEGCLFDYTHVAELIIDTEEYIDSFDFQDFRG